MAYSTKCYKVLKLRNFGNLCKSSIPDKQNYKVACAVFEGKGGRGVPTPLENEKLFNLRSKIIANMPRTPLPLRIRNFVIQVVINNNNNSNNNHLK